MAILQPILNIAEICARKNVKTAILCPGSRSAAITISMARHPDIKTYSISDERSAGFIGLGIAQMTDETVSLVCTSGTAAYNLAPAVAEAFFQEIPLLVLTADRPPEWINQYDGQTIYQENIFGKHVKQSYTLPSDYKHNDSVWQIERIINEAINLTQAFPKGPVHINIPIREPFYPLAHEEIKFENRVRIIESVFTSKRVSNLFFEGFYEIWRGCEKKLIIVGQQQNNKLSEILRNISDEFNVPVLSDIISNVNFINVISAHDIFLSSKNETFLETMSPDLIITCGKSIISKNLKQFIRNYKPNYHFHIQENPELIDPFQTLTHKIEVSDQYFFETLFSDLDIMNFKEGDNEDDNSEYFRLWQDANHRTRLKLSNFLLNPSYSEFKTVKKLIEKLPENSIFHLGNSMPVRYANLIGLSDDQNIQVFANRGTSGIDGILSSAVGNALSTTQLVICLIGDVSFFYDRNAFWNVYLPANLRIVLLNNHGGNIFRIIDGPNKQIELNDYFVTEQRFNAKNTCNDAGIEYALATNNEEIEKVLVHFFKISSKAKLLEIIVDGEISAEVFRDYKKLFADFS
ncbi:2-succinyl-5-enolpyruvyl-6-hydroxy-3-cyclohexene-1-carboxylic-acid synthase [Emticicia sp. BO119]|uniref:2-succinyl-5-enolpyruvyl-6-hydroxy-3- cyclohexene-1-carboxylic-acid synthase n=1 Tax=Emticicia sp. BO119 TaxID=2757768 RepID=UPI0015F0EC9A|nr:2-succinyl-5-enolpyruvyl-6-hydroxy-3-cyclohexene-1-carboxylic-acid synthase [Emticicia sp. BO119]MBA4853373.1 2-succinyl-5-enolpyruvyl-6-hydroxy-3-cyclohexene-1-carboxylic-acid synthase [Emticicia sp. BO119]